MEYYTNNGGGLMEELLGVSEVEHFTSEDFSSINGWNDLDFTFPTTNACFEHHLQHPIDHTINASASYALFGDDLFAPDFSQFSSPLNLDTQTPPYWRFDDVDDEALLGNGFLNPDTGAPYKPEPELPNFNPGTAERKKKAKKLNGQPSKNLMAERRRRKRLNDRLSMLRSVVPKISKMDRTSILGDTIDYMKELLDRINSLQEEMQMESNPEFSLMSIFNNAMPNDVLLRNSPKFEVERREEETRVGIRCGGKAGVLLSTLTTLEALGLEINHCVISCFNDFALQASCSEDLRRGALETEDIKQAVMRNAGYGGRCV